MFWERLAEVVRSRAEQRGWSGVSFILVTGFREDAFEGRVPMTVGEWDRAARMLGTTVADLALEAQRDADDVSSVTQ